MPHSQIALITGANRGLGLETAKQLAPHVGTIIITGRNQTQLDDISKGWSDSSTKLQTLVLDVENQNSINTAVQSVKEQYGKLDILINNAGVIVEGEWFNNTSTNVSMEHLVKTYNVNLFGVVAVTQAFLPLIKKSQAGRIVNVSSILGSLNVQSDANSDKAVVKTFAYNSSKAALNSFTIHLADALKDTHIRVNSAHPGWVKTDMGTDMAPLEVEDGAKTMVELSLIDAQGPNGGFFHMGEAMAW